MQNQTPMTKMQEHFRKLNELTSLIVNKIELTGRERKVNYYTYSESKGIDSDFIRIYANKSDKDQSFAFAFNNYQEGVEKTQIIVSIKENQNLISSHFSFADFKEKFREFLTLVSILKDSDALTYKSLKTTCDKVFSVSKGFGAVDYTAVAIQITNQLQKEVKEYSKLSSKLNQQRDVNRSTGKEISLKLEAYRKKLEEELKYNEGLIKEKELVNKIIDLKKSAGPKVLKELEEIQEQNKFVNIRGLKNNLPNAVNKVMAARTQEELTFSIDVVNSALSKK